MANEVFRASNDFNLIEFDRLNETDFDIFIALCVKLRNQADKKVTLSAAELRKITEYKGKPGQFAKALVGSVNKLLPIATREYYEKGFLAFNIFQAFNVPKDGSKLEVLFSEPARYMITDSEGLFIHARYEEYKKMHTFYSRRLYFMLKQWRVGQPEYYGHRGGHKWEVGEWRRLMCIPASYKWANIDKRVFEPVMRDFKEAGVFLDLKITKHKEGQGSRITHIEFSFLAEPQALYRELYGKNPEIKKVEKQIVELRKKASEAIDKGDEVNAYRYGRQASALETELEWLARGQMTFGEVEVHDDVPESIPDELEPAAVGEGEQLTWNDIRPRNIFERIAVHLFGADRPNREKEHSGDKGGYDITDKKKKAALRKVEKLLKAEKR